MRKIPTVFVRDPEDRRHVIDEVTPGCEWALAGEGVATRKYDGTCVMFDGSRWWFRRELKPGQPTPDGFQWTAFDEATGKTTGWVMESSFEPYLLEAIKGVGVFIPGTYELCGPKINGNSEGFTDHVLMSHDLAEKPHRAMDHPHLFTFEELKGLVLALPWEGIVWHHPDGRMAKLKRRDFPKVES